MSPPVLNSSNEIVQEYNVKCWVLEGIVAWETQGLYRSWKDIKNLELSNHLSFFHDNIFYVFSLL